MKTTFKTYASEGSCCQYWTENVSETMTLLESPFDVRCLSILLFLCLVFVQIISMLKNSVLKLPIIAEL